ncbi:hypothetical protein [Pseudoalteromonas rubra]|nr:hypothetical protein [Pseudoalteromonas rubra]
MVYYGTCTYEQTAFEALDYQQGYFSVAEKLASSLFIQPMHGYL